VISAREGEVGKALVGKQLRKSTAQAA